MKTLIDFRTRYLVFSIDACGLEWPPFWYDQHKDGSRSHHLFSFSVITTSRSCWGVSIFLPALSILVAFPFLQGKVKNQPPDLTAGEFNRGE